MNYLSHAYRFLDDPFFAAGTGFPDWMNVIDRKNRARERFAAPVVDDSDPEIAAFARGCVQHHKDDLWFHTKELFLRMNTEFAVEVKPLLGEGMGHQAAFLGHISVELLLDAILTERDPKLLERYYQNLAEISTDKMEEAANKICRKPVTLLKLLVQRFLKERFLADYYDDALLRMRLNGVMKRVGLTPLPQSVIPWLASARERVREATDELLAPPA